MGSGNGTEIGRKAVLRSLLHLAQGQQHLDQIRPVDGRYRAGMIGQIKVFPIPITQQTIKRFVRITDLKRNILFGDKYCRRDYLKTIHLSKQRPSMIVHGLFAPIIIARSGPRNKRPAALHEAKCRYIQPKYRPQDAFDSVRHAKFARTFRKGISYRIDSHISPIV